MPGAGDGDGVQGRRPWAGGWGEGVRAGAVGAGRQAAGPAAALLAHGPGRAGTRAGLPRAAAARSLLSKLIASSKAGTCARAWCQPFSEALAAHPAAPGA